MRFAITHPHLLLMIALAGCPKTGCNENYPDHFPQVSMVMKVKSMALEQLYPVLRKSRLLIQLLRPQTPSGTVAQSAFLLFRFSPVMVVCIVL